MNIFKHVFLLKPTSFCEHYLLMLIVGSFVQIKDLLGWRPFLSQLTGIHESRLDSFSTYLRNYFLGLVISSAQRGTDSSTRNVSRVNSTEVVSSTTNLSNVSAPFVRPSQCSRLGSSQENIAEYLLRVDEIVNAIRGIGGEIKEKVVDKVLRTLPMKYDSKVSSLE